MKIKIDGVPGFNATYDLDMTYFTMHELHVVKQTAGVRAGELSEAIQAGDNDVMVAFAIIAVERAGKTIHPDLLWNARSGSIVVEPDDLEEAAEEANPTVPPMPSSNSPDAVTREPSSVTSNDGSDETLATGLEPTGSPV